ncbi:MAG: hypothetical protein Kow0069_31860 [Promethearchaeota archaeon]
MQVEEWDYKPLPAILRTRPPRRTVAHKLAQAAYAVVTIGSFWALSVYTQARFPGGYSYVWNFISDQGGIAKNPGGHDLWNASVVVFGFLLLPVFWFLHRDVAVHDRGAARGATFAGVVACLGFSGVGVFPEDFRVPHLVVAVAFFFGQFVAANLYAFALLSTRALEFSTWRSRALRASLAPMNVAFVGFFAVPSARRLFYSPGEPYPGILSTALWEWAMMLGFVVWLFGFLAVVPHECGKRPREFNRLAYEVNPYRF